MKLLQNIGLGIKVIEVKLDEDHLHYFYQNRLGVTKRYKVRYEDFDFTLNRSFTYIKFIWLIAAIIIFLFMLYALYIEKDSVQYILDFVILIPVIFCIYMFVDSFKGFAYFPHVKDEMILIENQPNRTEYQNFLEKFEQKRKKYLRQVYGEIEIGEHPNSQLEKFKWLKSQEVINKEEFEQLKQKLLSGSPSNENSKPIGF